MSRVIGVSSKLYEIFYSYRIHLKENSFFIFIHIFDKHILHGKSFIINLCFQVLLELLNAAKISFEKQYRNKENILGY